MSRLRVLVVNDSATMRGALRAALAPAADIEVIGEAGDGSAAVDAVAALRPDVVLMDVVMPGRDGYEATRAIMARTPTPVIMVTAAVNPRDERVVFEALGAGALMVTRAPPAPTDPAYRLASGTLAQLVRSMASANVGGIRAAPSAPARAPEASSTGRIAAIGVVASAGGPPALVVLLKQLAQRGMPPILVVQHMTRGFSEGFSRWLADVTGNPVVIPTHGARSMQNTVYLAPDDRHLGVGADGTLVVSSDPPVGVFRPSGDYLLSSMASALGPAAAGVVLSGMGSDGAAGAMELAAAGGIVVAQDAGSAAVDGMPRAVRERVPAARVLPLGAIPGFLTSLSSSK